MESRRAWWIFLGAVVVAGIGSRMVHSGWLLVDKYLGDALYAVMFYALIRLAWRAPAWRVAVAAMGVMTVIEFFQLTMIPARMVASDNLLFQVTGRLLGTEFAWKDLAAYAVGILAVSRLAGRPPK